MEIERQSNHFSQSKENKYQMLNSPGSSKKTDKNSKTNSSSRRKSDSKKIQNVKKSSSLKFQKSKQEDCSLQKDTLLDNDIEMKQEDDDIEKKPLNKSSTLKTLVETLIEKVNEQDYICMENDSSSESSVVFHLPDSLLRSIFSETISNKFSFAKLDLSKDLLISLIDGLSEQVTSTKDLQLSSDTYQYIMAGAEASHIILNIITTKDAPKYVFIEEIMESLIVFTKFHLHESIISNSVTEPIPNEKQVKKLCNKLGELIEKFKDLVNNTKLTDTMILNLTSIGLPVFFTEGLEILHLRSIELLKSIFAEYNGHRTSILQELFHSLLKLPTTKRNLRKFKLIDEGKSIQMITALVLQLIQSCINTIDLSSFQDSINVCRSFLTLFLQKCTSSQESHQSEYKHLFENFVVDLLTMLYLPEWPVSETLISILSGMLISIMNSQSANSIKNGGLPEMNIKKSKEIDQARLFSLKLLGLIGTKLAHEVNESNKFNIFKDRKRQQRNDNAGPCDESEDASCICFQGFQQKFMLDCDRCNVWFHGECVGISPTDIPEVWYCDTCRILLQAQDKLKFNPTNIQKSKKKKINDENNNNDIMFNNKDTCDLISLQLIVNYLMKNDKNTLFARRYTCSLFNKNHPELKEDYNEIYDEIWNLIPNREIIQLSLSYRGTINLIRNMGKEKELLPRFKAVLHSILSVCNDRHMSFRATAVKSVASIVDANPSLLGEPEICKVVDERKLDLSVSVRQAIIDLVGNYILYQPSFIDQYYEMITDRIADTGISVRKRVIKILMNICMQEPSNPKIIDICGKLATRINDEESISSLVLKIYQDLWFNDSKKIKHSDINTRIEQIYAVVSNSQSSHKWFIMLIKSIIESKDSKKQPIRNIIKEMCHNIIEKMIISEENFSKLNNKQQLSQQDEFTKSLVKNLNVLNLFCEADPEFLKPHALTLQPYLQTEQSKSEGATLYCLVIEILEKVMPLLKNSMSQEFLLGLEEDLSHLIHTHSSMKVVQASVRCLCVVVSTLTKHSIFLEEMLCSFSDALENTSLAKSNPATVMRYLFACGLLCRYYDFDINQSANTWKQQSSKSSNGIPQSSTIFKILLNYMDGYSPAIMIKALQGLGHLFIRNPSLMVKCNSLFTSILSTPSNQICIPHLLKNFSDFLIQEQETLEVQNINVQPIRDQSDSGPRVIQSNISYILPIMLCKTPNLRIEALTVIGQLLKHGLAHPVKVAPYLIALLADRTQSCSEQALQWLHFIHQKNPPLLLSRIVDGIKLSFSFQTSVFQYANALVISKFSQGTESLLSNLYRLFRSKKTTREQFLRTLINLMENCNNNSRGTFLKYLGDLIAFLPFEVIGEPLSVIHSIDKIISLKTGSILKSFKKILSNDKNKTVTEELKQHCFDACLPIILLKLKSFLKLGYSISTSRCESYSPSDNTNNTITVKLIDTATIFTPFSDIPVLNTTDKITLVDCNQQYQLLKQLFVQDDIESYSDTSIPKVSKKKISSKRKTTPKKPKRTDLPSPNISFEPKTTRKRRRVDYAADYDDTDYEPARKKTKYSNDEEYIPGE